MGALLSETFFLFFFQKKGLKSKVIGLKDNQK
jgi:hypothetical protein